MANMRKTCYKTMSGKVRKREPWVLTISLRYKNYTTIKFLTVGGVILRELILLLLTEMFSWIP